MNHKLMQIFWMNREQYETHAPAPNTALAIYQNASAAQKSIDASPLRFELEIRDPGWEAQSDPLDPFESDSIAEVPRREENHAAEGSRSGEKAFFQKEDESDISDELHPVYGTSDPQRLNTAAEATFQGLSRFQTRDNIGPLAKASLSQTANRSPPKSFSLNHAPAGTHSPAAQISVSRSPPTPTSPPPPQFREFHLTISPSTFNHQGYLERQGYYGGFTPDMASMAASDLEGRVPLPGMADCRLKKGEAPTRTTVKWKEKAMKAREEPSWMELWREGRESRNPKNG